MSALRFTPEIDAGQVDESFVRPKEFGHTRTSFPSETDLAVHESKYGGRTIDPTESLGLLSIRLHPAFGKLALKIVEGSKRAIAGASAQEEFKC